MNEDKPYRIRLEDRGDYLYALVGGELLTADIAKDYWDEIAAECGKTGAGKILIEKDFAKHVSPSEMLEMAVYVGRILAGKKIAFYDRYDNQDTNELGKVVARNEGVIMRVFDRLEDAERWIGEMS